MRIISPRNGERYLISAEPEWPSIAFEADAASTQPKLTWTWSLQWKGFSKSGVDVTTTNTWDAREVTVNRGGTLTVSVQGTTASAPVTVHIQGSQPREESIHQYLISKPCGLGFEKILKHETHCMHFDRNGEPQRSFDNGYGMAQLTTPPPTYEQAWNWKLNIDGALELFDAKRRAAVAYLGQEGRAYTEGQLMREAVCRWNGGAYHVWDAHKGWARNPHVLCDSLTGNIGWDSTHPSNAAKTEAQLHERDRKQFNRPPPADACWRYFGVCYADRILA